MECFVFEPVCQNRSNESNSSPFFIQHSNCSLWFIYHGQIAEALLLQETVNGRHGSVLCGAIDCVPHLHSAVLHDVKPKNGGTGVGLGEQTRCEPETPSELVQISSVKVQGISCAWWWNWNTCTLASVVCFICIHACDLASYDKKPKWSWIEPCLDLI